MRLPQPLIEGRFVRRYQRFFADVALADGAVVTAHCPNPGRMIGLLQDGAPCWLSRSDNPKRRLAYTLELMASDGTLVGVNTNLPNRLAPQALAAGAIAELAGYASLRREVRYGKNSRIDLLLEDPARAPAYVEIKNVHWKRDGLAVFPDAVTARGAKHLDELRQVVAAGGRAVMLYIVQRSDCRGFALADDIDPNYLCAFERARDAGVEAMAYGCHLTLEDIELGDRLGLHVRSPLVEA
ncbi:MAG: DNA/RNA nuclease SfsA [Geminicoccaceae bacterium]